jgi:hypothetical protein
LGEVQAWGWLLPDFDIDAFPLGYGTALPKVQMEPVWRPGFEVQCAPSNDHLS